LARKPRTSPTRSASRPRIGPILVMKVNAEGKIAPQGTVITKEEIDKLLK
jgi:hypothetical protein